MRHDHKRHQFHTLANHPYEKIIVGNSISKTFNCNSLKGGFGIIKSENVKKDFMNIAMNGMKLMVNEPACIMS